MSEHPCGALPVTGWSVSLWWCHHHQAYFGMATGYTQRSDDDLDPWHQARMEFGPFDQWPEVERWLQSQWIAMSPRNPPT